MSYTFHKLLGGIEIKCIGHMSDAVYYGHTADRLAEYSRKRYIRRDYAKQRYDISPTAHIFQK